MSPGRLAAAEQEAANSLTRDLHRALHAIPLDQVRTTDDARAAVLRLHSVWCRWVVGREPDDDDSPLTEGEIVLLRLELL